MAKRVTSLRNPSSSYCARATHLLSKKCHCDDKPLTALYPISLARYSTFRPTDRETNALQLELWLVLDISSNLDRVQTLHVTHRWLVFHSVQILLRLLSTPWAAFHCNEFQAPCRKCFHPDRNQKKNNTMIEACTPGNVT